MHDQAIRTRDDAALAANPERRASLRHKAIDRRAQLAWRGAGKPTTKAPALLLDIGGRGANVIVRTLPPPDGPIWLGLESLAGEWVRVSIRAIRVEADRWIIHLAFSETCPAGLFERATYGDLREPPTWERSRPPFRLEIDWLPPWPAGEESGESIGTPQTLR